MKHYNMVQSRRSYLWIVYRYGCPGNVYEDACQRTARAVMWALERSRT